MTEPVSQVSMGKKIIFAIISFVAAGLYFHFLDIVLMDMQGLDYLYLFRK